MTNGSIHKSLGICASAVIICAISTNTFAAYVESAIGNAVVNDASAIYYNPAALTLVPNKQLVVSEVTSSVLLSFNGTTVHRADNFVQTGTANSRTYYYLPYAYFAYPVNDRITLGLGELYTFYGIGNFPSDSILRYVQTYSYFSTLDLTPGIGVKLDKNIAIGAGLDFEFARITLNSMSGFPGFGIPDTKIENGANAHGLGAHAGFLLTPARGTTIGVTYHSAISYNMSGHSTFESNPPVYTNHFSLKLVSPPSIVGSIDQFFTPKLGFMATIERMMWDSVRNLNLQNVAFRVLGVPVILPSANQQYFLHNTLRYSLGAHYQALPQLTLRGTVAYDEDPGNASAQVVPGDNIIVGVNAGYAINKMFTLDLSYSHVFYRRQSLNIVNSSNIITGAGSGGRDVGAIKLTWNIV